MTKAYTDTYRILAVDPWLKPYAKDIELRMKRYKALKKALLGADGSFEAFANGHLFYGFHRTADGWIYREWAPGAIQMYLTGDFNNWNRSSHPLRRLDSDNWEIFIPGTEALRHESLVKVVIVTADAVRDRIPLYIRRTVQNRDTHDFSGQIWDPPVPYAWVNDDRIKASTDPMLIYEAHVGMAQEKEAIGSYREFADLILPRIKQNGYTVVQLMAVMSHPYYASFGYHVSNFYAVSSWFGTPDDLKYLIDKAHGLGIRVLMDLVHSHAVKNLAEGINEFDGTRTQFFHKGARGLHPAWDSMVFDYGKHEVLHFLLSNLKFWLEEYHLDGFRFDGITSMLYLNHGLGVSFNNYKMYFDVNTDIDALNYLQLANELIREVRPDAVTIAEDMSGMPGMCLPVKDGGIGFDYRLNMGVPDYWIKLLTTLTDERWNVGNIWYELNGRRPEEKQIGYCESHDQALVGDKTIFFRLGDKEIYEHMSKFSQSIIIDRAMSLHKLIRFITLCLCGEGYLNFMGNEFGHPEWIDFPREGNQWSFKHCRRQWSLVDTDHLRFRDLNRFDHDMLAFVKDFRLLASNPAVSLWNDEDNKLIAFERAGLVFLFNFSPDRSIQDYELPTTSSGSFRVVFDSDTSEYGGQNRISKDYVYTTESLSSKPGTIGIKIYTPSRTVMVLQQQEDKA